MDQMLNHLIQKYSILQRKGIDLLLSVHMFRCVTFQYHREYAIDALHLGRQEYQFPYYLELESQCLELSTLSKDEYA